MTPKQLSRMALLTALALIIFMVEAQIPSPVPIPGVKLGLANVITVYAVFVLGPAPAFAILFCRVFLGSVFSGQMMTFLYSLGGGILCWWAMCGLRRILTPSKIWICSVFGAIFHNIGQIIVAIAIARTPSLLAYLPVLLISGIITGTLTGLAAQLLINRLDHLKQH